jgi:hypothetical protein
MFHFEIRFDNARISRDRRLSALTFFKHSQVVPSVDSNRFTSWQPQSHSFSCLRNLLEVIARELCIFQVYLSPGEMDLLLPSLRRRLFLRIIRFLPRALPILICFITTIINDFLQTDKSNHHVWQQRSSTLKRSGFLRSTLEQHHVHRPDVRSLPPNSPTMVMIIRGRTLRYEVLCPSGTTLPVPYPFRAILVARRSHFFFTRFHTCRVLHVTLWFSIVHPVFFTSHSHTQPW